MYCIMEISIGNIILGAVFVGTVAVILNQTQKNDRRRNKERFRDRIIYRIKEDLKKEEMKRDERKRTDKK